MSQSKFTPGPWKVKRSTHFVEGNIKEYHWVGFGTIGDETPVLTKSIPENEANAALIAAAPEMFEALNRLLNDDGLMNAMSKDQARGVMYSLAKARGES